MPKRMSARQIRRWTQHGAPGRLVRRMERFGCRLSMRTKGRSWDGETISIPMSNGLSDLLHEIAHFIMCPKKRRGVPNFGLGSVDWDEDIRRLKPTALFDVECAEEQMASCLGILMEREFKLDWRTSADNQNWNAHDIDGKPVVISEVFNEALPGLEGRDLVRNYRLLRRGIR